MQNIMLKAGTGGENQEFDLTVPKTVKEFLDKGYSMEAIEEMLALDLRRKLAVVVRQDMDSDSPSVPEDLKTRLEAYVYVPGRKPGTGKTAQDVERGRKKAWTQMQALTDEEILTLRKFSAEDQEKIFALPTMEEMKSAIANG